MLLHTLQFSHLDLASDCRPNRNPKPGGHLECGSCLCTFLFYDKLRSVALAKLNEDPNRQAEIADVLHTINQCERHSYRYMAHVMLAAQQAHHMKLAITQMDSSTAYIVSSRSFLQRRSMRAETPTMARRECCGGVLECMSSHILGSLLWALRQQVNCMWRLTSLLI